MNIESQSHADQCVPSDVLQAALQSRLDAQAQDNLETHLVNCESCRTQFEQLAGDASFWQQASKTLRRAELETSIDSRGSTPRNDSVFMRLDASAGLPRVEPVFQDDSDEETRDRLEASTLLDAPQHPEMLGRIDGFNVEQMIGRGGMGVVFKGFDSDLNRPVAIKFLSPHLAANGVARKRFSREARAAAAVMHPNVVPIHSVNASSVRPYLVMAMVPGKSLQKHVEDSGPLNVKDVIRIGQQVAAGLAAAHAQGLVHRDIKPANILLGKDVSRAMITDFGLARAADDAALTQSGWLAGTPHYMSPEQAMGNDVDPRSDLFSLGSVMYFMATGREPFRAEKSWAVLQKIITDQPQSPRSINSDVPIALERLIERLMERDPESRFSSASDAQEAMQNYLAHLQNPKVHALPKFERSAMNSKGQGRAFSWRGLTWGAVTLAASIFVGSGAVGLIQSFNKASLKKPISTGDYSNGKNVYRSNSRAQSFGGYVPSRPEPNALSSGFRSAFSAERNETEQIGSALNALENMEGSENSMTDSFSTEVKALSRDIGRLEGRFLE